MYPRAFQFASPLNIASFIESRLEFYDGRNIFSTFGSFLESPDDRALAAGSIQNLFNGQHVGVVSRFLEKSNNGFKALVGVAQQQVSFGDCLEHALGRIDDRRPLWYPCRISQRGEPLHVRQVHHTRQIQRTGKLEYVAWVQPQIILEELERWLRRRIRNL